MTQPAVTAPAVVIRPPVPDPPGTVYPDWTMFYDQILRHIFARDPELEPGWCPQWRDHPAAAFAVDSLWRAWEDLQRDPGSGQASWLVNLAIPAMRELLDERGTFAGCSATRHTPLTQPLP